MALSLIGTSCSPLDQAPFDYGSVNPAQTVRTFHRISCDITAIKLVYSNKYYSSDGQDGTVPNPFTVSASVERVPLANSANINVMTGTLVPVPFGGTPTGSFTTALSILESDLTPFVASAGDIVMVRTYAVPSGGITLPSGGLLLGSTLDAGRDYGEGTALTDTTRGGNMTPSSGVPAIRPIAILGQATDGNVHPSVAIVGDSISAGTVDGGGIGHNGDNGFLVRACLRQDVFVPDPFSATVPIGYVQCSRGGEQLHQWVDFTKNTIKPLASLYATDVWSFLWGNDIGLGDAVIKADLVTIANWYTSRAKTYRSATHKPGSSSTDGFKTIAGQTLDANSGLTKGIQTFLRDTTATGFKQSCANPGSVFVSDMTALVSVDAAGAPSQDTMYWPPAEPTIILSGSCTSANNGFIQDTTKNLPRLSLKGYTVFLTSATNVIQAAVIQWNDVNRIVANGLTSATGDVYEIRKSYTVDGGHPATLGHQKMATVWTPAMLTGSAVPPTTDPYKSDYTNAAFVEVNFKPNPPGSFTATGLGTALRPEGDLIYTVPANMQGGRIVFERRLHGTTDPWIAIGKVDGPDANTPPPATYQDLTVLNSITYEWRAYALPKGDFNPAVFP